MIDVRPLTTVLAVVLASLSAMLLSNDVGAQEAGPTQYIVHSGDQLRIRVWPDSMLGGLFIVEDDGFVHLPVIGSFQVAGMPLDQLRRAFRENYSRALKDPAVSVVPLFRVSVLGAVQRPGLYEATSTQSVIDAISLAGGFDDNAAAGKVRLIRDGRVVQLDLADPSSVGSAGLELRSGDRIVVPQGIGIDFRTVLYVLQSVAIIATLLVRP